MYMNAKPRSLLNRLLLMVGAFILAPPTVSATPIIANGDFSDPIPLAGWTPTGAILGEPTGEFAQLETDGSFDRILEQGFGIPPTASELWFDFAFSTANPGGPGLFPDSFAVSLFTEGGDFLDILVVDILGPLPDPSDGFEQITGAVPIDVHLDESVTIPGFAPLANGTSFGGRIRLGLPAEVLGENATLFFELFDDVPNDTTSTIAAVDNVGVLPASVPVPATAQLLLLGLLLCRYRPGFLTRVPGYRTVK